MGYHLDPNDIQSVAEHLRFLSWLTGERIITVQKIGDGNMNLTVRLRTDSGLSYVLKQARPWVEKYPHIAAPIERAQVEAMFYRVCQRTAIADWMPKLMGFDGESNLLLLEDLGDLRDFTNSYRSHRLPEAVLHRLLEYLSELHQMNLPDEVDLVFQNRAMRKLNHYHQYVFPLEESNGLDLDRITPGLSRLAENLKRNSEFCSQVTALGERYLADGPTLLHGDFFPGSWLAHENDVKVIDPEFCFLGTREYDLGILLAHLELINAGNWDDAVTEWYAGAVDWPLVRQFGGAEMMRRLIGVAQLPLQASLDQKASWLQAAEKWVCGH